MKPYPLSLSVEDSLNIASTLTYPSFSSYHLRCTSSDTEKCRKINRKSNKAYWLFFTFPSCINIRYSQSHPYIFYYTITTAFNPTTNNTTFFWDASAQLKPRPPFLEVSGLHTHTHTRPVGLFWTSVHFVPEVTTTCTTKTQVTNMPSEGFEPVIPTIERLQT